ncbi:MAG: IPT/TIG domain-containing protein, partial [Acidobacteriota bacterium]
RPNASMAQRRFRFGFILITAAGQEPSADDLSKLDTFRQQFEPYYHTATSDRAEADTGLRRAVQFSMWPATGLVVGTTARATVTLDRPSSTDLTFRLQSANSLVQIPSSFTVPAGAFGVVFNWTATTPGIDEITIQSDDTSYAPEVARVQILAGPAPLSLRVVSGDKQRASGDVALPESIRVQVVDSNLVPYAGYVVRAAPVSGGSVSPTSATSDESGFVRFNWVPGPGPVYQLNLVIESNGAVAAATALSRPFIADGGIVNAASFVPGIVSGGIGTIFGASLAAGATASGTVPFSDSLANVRVSISGLPASLLYVSDSQINFVAPPGLAPGQGQVTVTAGSPAETSNTLTVPILATQPGIFVRGNAAAAIRNGEFLEIYCTGLGATQASAQNIFLEETTTRPRVTIAGRDAEVLFSGLAPGYTGLYQVNVRIPAGVSGLQPVQIFQGSSTSNVTQFGF